MLWFGQLVSHAAALQKFVHTDLPHIAGTQPVALSILCEPVNAEDAARYFGPPPETRGIHFEQWSVPALDQRSEEHTSELQSLMRISYAVFCLKKKNFSLIIIKSITSLIDISSCMINQCTSYN